MYPEAATSRATLRKRYPAATRQQIYAQLIQEENAARVEIHLDYIALPPAANAEENMRRSAEEGQKTVDAQGKVDDGIRQEYRLTDFEMDDLIQEAQDNHWGQ